MAASNDKLRAARRAIRSRVDPGQPISRAELAEEVNSYLREASGRTRRHCLDEHTIGRYERGELRWPSAAYREGLRALLRADSDADLGFFPTRRGNTTTPKATKTLPADHDPTIREWNHQSSHTSRIVHVFANPLDWEMWDNTKRRTFLINAAGTVAAVLASIEVPDSQRTCHIDSETIEALEQTTLGFRRAYRSAGALSLLGPSHGTLNLLTEMVPRSGKHQDRLVTAIGQMAALIGTMLSLDLGDFEAGQRYLSIAARAAQQAGNNDLLAFALGARAFNAAYGTDPRAGLDYADSALAVARRGVSPITHGWLSAVASEMHATDQNEVACRRLVEDSATYLEIADPAEPWTGVGVFNKEKLAAYLGGDLMRLGRYGEAQGVLHQALTRLDPTLAKHRCTAYVDLAEAYAAEGKLDEAAHHAVKAIPIVTNTRHAASLRRIQRLYRRMSPGNSNATRRFGEKLVEMRAAW